MTEDPASGERSWWWGNRGARVGHVRQAVVLSADGLTMATSQGLSLDDADHLSALAAGVQSLARGASRRFRGGDIRQTVIEMDDALLFITAAGQGACLAVLADGDADAGLIAYEMTVLVERGGQHLAANPRVPGRGTRPVGERSSDLIDIVMATGAEPRRAFSPGPEHWRILSLCQRPLVVAELAAAMGLPLGVVHVLLGD